MCSAVIRGAADSLARNGAGAPMVVLRIDIRKTADGAGLLRCTREDGSVTWQKQPKHGAHFALHDLTHYSVETVLGYSRGFFGLIAAGWDLDDVTGKGARGPLPPEAVEVERVVGLFDSERGSGCLWSTAEFNSFSPRQLTEQEIRDVRALRAELFRQWFATEPGKSLQLRFEARTSAASTSSSARV
jgi:hypothetical protein